jgi:hypothetical protein
MSDINEQLESISQKVAVLKNNPVTKFSYTQAAYTGDIANGVGAYDYAAENNIPITSATDTNDIVLSKGLRAQSSAVPRMLLNHIFGRTSYNLNKIVDYFKILVDSVVDLNKKGGRYQTTVKYAHLDSCTFSTTEDGQVKLRTFVRTSVTPQYLVGVPPAYIDGFGNVVVNSLHWIATSGDAIRMNKNTLYTGLADTITVPEYVDEMFVNMVSYADTINAYIDIQHHIRKGKSLVLSVASAGSAPNSMRTRVIAISNDPQNPIQSYGLSNMSLQFQSGVTGIAVIENGNSRSNIILQRSAVSNFTYKVFLENSFRLRWIVNIYQQESVRQASVYVGTTPNMAPAGGFVDVTTATSLDIVITKSSSLLLFCLDVSLREIGAYSGGLFIVIKDELIVHRLNNAAGNNAAIATYRYSGGSKTTKLVIPVIRLTSIPGSIGYNDPVGLSYAYVKVPSDTIPGCTEANSVVLMLCSGYSMANATGYTTSYLQKSVSNFQTWQPSIGAEITIPLF